MPQFILDTGNAAQTAAFNALDSFTQGYVTCALWADCNGDQFDRDGEATFAELAPETLVRMVADCVHFQAYTGALLDLYQERHGRDRDSAGHDFWLSRNGHGTGFWDRGAGAVGDKLHDMAKTFREMSLYLGDDGLIYA
ncbi:hypothetical protein [Methylobacterium fujisawaense]